MRINTNLPKDETFFSKYADLLPTLNFSTIVANIISAATEIFTIFTICNLKLQELAPEYAFEVSVGIAVLGTAFIELGLRKFCPAAVKAILYKRFKGLELWLSIFLFMICGVLIFSSATLSFSGSYEIVENLTGEIIEENDGEISKRRDRRENRILGDYDKDKGDINKRFDAQIKSAQKALDAKIDKQWNEHRKYRIKENNEGKSYKSKKGKIKGKIDDLKAERAAAVAQLEMERNTTLDKALSAKSGSLEEIKGDYQNDKGDIKSKNQKRQNKRTSKVEKYGLGLGYFTLVCLFIFILCTIIIEIIKKGSQIEEKPMPSVYFFKEDFLSDFWETITEHLQRIGFGILHWWKQKIKAPLPPTDKDIPVLFETNVKQPKINIEFDKSEGKPKIELPPISSNFLEQIEKRSEGKLKHDENEFILKNGSQNMSASTTIYAKADNTNNRKQNSPYSNTNDNTTTRKGSTNLRQKREHSNNTKIQTKDYIIYDGKQHELQQKKYSYSRVTSLISTHKKRIKELKPLVKNGTSNRHKKALENNTDWLNYWEGRVKEFFV